MPERLDVSELGALAWADLEALPPWLLYGGESSPLYRCLAAEAVGRLRVRAEEVARVQTASQWQERQQAVRQTLVRLVGPFPERTPLNARLTGVVKRGGYRIDKVAIEARPGFHVTGCVFVPEGLTAPAPAILNPIGHTYIAFRGRLYQQMILNLVAKGFIVYAYDPIGQGERVQYYDPEIGHSRIGDHNPVREHCYVGYQCFTAGSNLARYWTWDGIRAIDYLLSRDDVDARRIGVTGISGGGTATAYITAFDDRIAASSPCCYITGFRRLLESIGPQDAEQNVPGGIAAGIDHADLLAVAAPKPLLMAAATRDFFSIQGARESFAELGRAYAALGASDRLEMIEDDLEHGYSRKIREATYGFFQRHLGLPGDPSEVDVDYLAPEDLHVTRTGQLSTSFGGETVYSLNRLEAERLPVARGDVVAAARRLSGYREPQRIEAAFVGRHNHDGFCIEQYSVSGEGDYRMPVAIAVPCGGTGRVALCLTPGGRKAALACELAGWLLGRGVAVASADISGVGELAAPMGDPGLREAYAAVQLGRSVVGVQAADIVRLVRFLAGWQSGRAVEVAAIADDALCPAMLHAAAFEPALARVALVRPLVSYRAVVNSRFHMLSFSTLIHGVLTAYDLPDLMAALAPRPLLLASTSDANGEALAPESAREQLACVAESYGRGPLWLRAWQAGQPCGEVFGDWLA